MPWLKAGDNAATHPILLRVGPLAEGDPRSTNEVFGFIVRCALQSAGHLTDYVIEDGTAFMIGGAEAPRLLELARRAGFLKRIKHQGHQAWRLVDDPDFLHIRLKAEVDWEKQQRADASNTALTVPVRHRDGDSCRYCGSIVFWSARKGARAGTYDHREPGKPAKFETFVVACGGCNSGRGADPAADERYPLKPVPPKPFYSTKTAEFLARHGIHVQASDADARAVIQPAIAPVPPTVSGHHGDLASSAATPTVTSPESADLLPRAGTGRDGTGRVGQELPGTGTGDWDWTGRRGPRPPHRRKRSARGRPR